MRIQTSQFHRSLIAGAGIALAFACAGGLALFDWIPGSTSSTIGARAAFASKDGAQLRALARFPSRARCDTCNIDLLNGVGSDDASQNEQCIDGTAGGILTSHAIQDMQATNLAILLDWHATAHTGYGLDNDGIFCSVQSARTVPLPIAASDVYEQLARPRDAMSKTPVNGGTPAAVEKALQKVAD